MNIQTTTFGELRNNTLFVKVAKNGKIIPAICEKIRMVAGANCQEMPTDNLEGMCRGHIYYVFIEDTCTVIPCAD